MSLSDRSLRILYGKEDGNSNSYERLDEIKLFLFQSLTNNSKGAIKARENHTYYSQFEDLLIRTKPETFELSISDDETGERKECGKASFFEMPEGSRSIDVAVLKTLIENNGEEIVLSAFQRNYDLSVGLQNWDDYDLPFEEKDKMIKTPEDVDIIILHRIVKRYYQELVPIRELCAENELVAQLLPQKIEEIITDEVMNASVIGDSIYRGGIQSTIIPKLRNGLIYGYKKEERGYSPMQNIEKIKVEHSNKPEVEI